MSKPLARSMLVNRGQRRGTAKQRVSHHRVCKLRAAGIPSDSDEYYDLVDLVFHTIPKTADQLNYYETNAETCPRCVLCGRGYQGCCNWQRTTRCRPAWRNDDKIGYWTKRKRPERGG